MHRPLAAACCLVLAACRSAPEPGRPTAGGAPLVLRGAVVRASGDALEDAVVVVEGQRIAAMGRARDVPVPPDATALGGPGSFIVAGLVDAHVHFFQSGRLATRPDVLDVTARVPYREERARIAAELDTTFRRYLRAGITGVIDFGGPMWNFEVRERAARSPLAPRVAVAGPLLASVSRPQLALDDPPIVQVTDPAAARAMVRELAARHPDFVKLWWVVPAGAAPEAWTPVARAAVEEAHAAGLRVAVHATELATAKAALRAGADVLVHGVFTGEVDAEFLDLLRARRVPYVTTLTVLQGYRDVLGKRVRLGGPDLELADPASVATVLEDFDAPAGRSGRPIPPEAARNVKRVWDAGGLVVAGSDAGNIGTFHAAGLHRELEALVAAGLSPAQALAAATIQAARLLGRSDLGDVAPGLTADLLVLEADPRASVANLRRITWVVKGGVARRPDEILARTAADVVQMQANAYNARDADAFAATYAEDAVVARAASGEVLARGRAAIRDRYAKLFESSPTSRLRIAERRTEGEAVVLDHEIVTGRAPERPDPWDVGVVRYEVGAGLIRRAELP
ncbi:MAG TPA: amidohydrolase family protein [Anaeromyxobacteraceae bacterium]|nr:amidohydrolase family protein [Anaeromyxobacteraceae bacterium]